jgi:GT2 family glycosyltransferase
VNLRTPTPDRRVAGGIAAPVRVATLTCSVVIPTYNEAEDIGDTLDRVFAQGVQPADVVLVDGGSTDDTLRGVRAHPFASRITIIEERTRRGVSAARNTGIRAATGDVVVILNADVFLPPDFIERILALYRDGADFVSVDSRVENTGAAIGRYTDAVHRVKYGARSVGWTEGFSCRREAALAAGFPEEIPGAGGEDVEFVDRLLARGYNWKVDYTICVTHRVPAAIGDFFRQCRGRGRAVPYIEHSLRGMPLQLVMLRRSLVALRTAAEAALLVPNVLVAIRLARSSPRGLRDAPRFWLLHHVLFAGLRAGELDSLRALWRRKDASR